MTPTDMNSGFSTNGCASGCGYTDGPSYVECKVAERGWPTPKYMNGGKKKKRVSKKRKNSKGKKAKKSKNLVRNNTVSQKKTQHRNGKPYKKKSSRRYHR